MSEDIKPKTLNGVRKLAKKIEKAENITRTEALERAAKQAGYQNYRHAFVHLPEKSNV